MEAMDNMLEIVLYVVGIILGVALVILVLNSFIRMRRMGKSADTLKEELDSRLDDINDLRQGKKPRSTSKIQYRNKI